MLVKLKNIDTPNFNFFPPSIFTSLCCYNHRKPVSIKILITLSFRPAYYSFSEQICLLFTWEKKQNKSSFSTYSTHANYIPLCFL